MSLQISWKLLRFGQIFVTISKVWPSCSSNAVKRARSNGLWLCSMARIHDRRKCNGYYKNGIEIDRRKQLW